LADAIPAVTAAQNTAAQIAANQATGTSGTDWTTIAVIGGTILTVIVFFRSGGKSA
jgi:hypothetical protein